MNQTPTEKFLPNVAKSIASERWIKMFKQGKINKLTKEFCIAFQHFADFSYATLTDENYTVINGIVGQFLFIMSRPEYQIPEKYVVKMVELGPIIANVTAMSTFQTTDEALLIVVDHPANFHKLLVLCSARNRNQIKAEALFRVDATRASQWYWSYFITPGSYPSKTVYENMRRHIAHVDPDLKVLDSSVLVAYFNSTYVDNIGYRHLKERINAQIQEVTKGIKVENTPDGTIAICTAKWYPRSAVYRCIAKGVHAVGKRHRMELIHLGDDEPEIDKSGFAAVHTVKLAHGDLDIKAIAKNNYSAVFFPDIGMSFESVYLSNIRLAPIQIVGYGHPSSTFGAKVDYVIGGEKLELREDATRNYSEKLVTIPGNGQPSTRPCHMNHVTAKENCAQHRRPDRVVINCPWSQDKTIYPLVDCLRKIKDRCKTPVLFRLFPNEAVNRANYFLPYVQGICETLQDPECVEVHLAFGQDYMTRMAAGDLALDSWPFNGYNTVIDSLLLGLPMVTLQGRQCFERVGAEILNRYGFGFLVAHSEDEYIDKVVALVDQPEWRKEWTKKIGDFKLDFDEQNGEAFAGAVDAILRGDYE